MPVVGDIEQVCRLIHNNRRVTADEVANQLQISVMALSMKSSRTSFTSVKSVQGGFQNNLQNSRSITLDVCDCLLHKYHEEG